MTDNEIIKALKVCSTYAVPQCESCPYYKQDDCVEKSASDAVDLIKRQQEHIEDLEAMTKLRNKRHYYDRFVKEVYQKEKGELSYPDFDEIYKRYFEQQEMIDALIAGQETLQKHFADKMVNLKWWLDTNEENGVVYIPKFVVEKIVRGETDDK